MYKGGGKVRKDWVKPPPSPAKFVPPPGKTVPPPPAPSRPGGAQDWSGPPPQHDWNGGPPPQQEWNGGPPLQQSWNGGAPPRQDWRGPQPQQDRSDPPSQLDQGNPPLQQPPRWSEPSASPSWAQPDWDGALPKGLPKGTPKGSSKGWAKPDWSGPQASDWPLPPPKPVQVPSSSSSSPAEIASFTVVKGRRYNGRVLNFQKWEGHGYIRPSEGQQLPRGSISVNCADIQTADRFPQLMEDQDVEFGVVKWNERGEPSLRAIDVTLAGGGMVSIQEQEDLDRDFLGGMAARFAGTLKFFMPMKGVGYISLEENIACDMELALPQEIVVDAMEVNCGGKRPTRLDNLEVEFGIYKDRQAQKFQAHNMTLPGGKPFVNEHLLHRDVIKDELFMGSIAFWNWTDLWGFITVAEGSNIPERVQQKIDKQTELAALKGKMRKGNEARVYFRAENIAEPFCPQEGLQVFFNLYVDDRGAGAANIIHDPTPLGGKKE